MNWTGFWSSSSQVLKSGTAALLRTCSTELRPRPGRLAAPVCLVPLPRPRMSCPSLPSIASNSQHRWSISCMSVCHQSPSLRVFAVAAPTPTASHQSPPMTMVDGREGRRPGRTLLLLLPGDGSIAVAAAARLASHR